MARKSKKELKMLSLAELNKLTTARLKNVLNSARAVHSSNQKHLDELALDEIDLVLQQKTDSTGRYLALVKQVLSSRPHEA